MILLISQLPIPEVKAVANVKNKILNWDPVQTTKMNNGKMTEAVITLVGMEEYLNRFNIEKLRSISKSSLPRFEII